jgi:hypothetical protein
VPFLFEGEKVTMADEKKTTPAKTAKKKVATKKAPAKKVVIKKVASGKAVAEKKVVVAKKVAKKRGAMAKKVAPKNASAAPVRPASRPAPSAAPAPQPKAISETQSALQRSERPDTSQPIEVTPEQRTAMIREAAYYKAEKRDFAPGFEAEDWDEAEREVDEKLHRG